jgi:hypothetical protein
MIDKDDWGNILQWVVIFLLIVLLESHAVNRPIVYLVGPLLVLAVNRMVGVPIHKLAWVAAALVSIAGFLLTTYVFR